MSEPSTQDTASEDTTSMREVRHEAWPPGTPCWVDISVTDPARARAFYAAVLGWEFSDQDERLGGYVTALVDGERVAGLAPPMPPGLSDGPEPPHVWTTYLAADDLASLTERVTAAGGQVVMPAMPLEELGAMALFLDPTGAGFGVWQAGQHTGATLVNAPGALAWSDVMVGDFAAGRQFYAEVFGYRYDDLAGGGLPYALFTPPGAPRPAGGIGQVGEGGFPHWVVTFGVADADVAVRQARAHGGSVVTEPYDFEFGRAAIVVGPDGETFGVFRPGTS